MKKISLWAKNHVFITRVIVSFIHALLILIAFYLSKNLQFNFSISSLIVVVIILSGVSILYPYTKRISYTFQKTMLFITSTCFFLITCFFNKHNFSLLNFQAASTTVSLPIDSSNKKSVAEMIELLRTNNNLSRSEKHTLRKELRSELRKEIKAYKKIGKPHRPTKQDALLILLIVLSGVGLLYGLAIILCSISCGGIPAIVLIFTSFGIAGIGVGLYFLIRKLRRNIERNEAIEG